MQGFKMIPVFLMDKEIKIRYMLVDFHRFSPRVLLAAPRLGLRLRCSLMTSSKELSLLDKPAKRLLPLKSFSQSFTSKIKPKCSNNKQKGNGEE